MKLTNKTKQFLDAVWGSDTGMRVVSTLTSGKKFSSTSHSTNEDAIQCIEAAIEKGSQCFYGVHLFEGNNRKSENALGCRALYLDIDVNPAKHGYYESQEAAVDALKPVLIHMGLKEAPTILSSGNGIHVLFFLDELLDESSWLESAEHLRAICKAQGLKADKVTTDHARVLRVPESFNYKDADNPKECKILNEIRTFDIETLRAKLRDSAPTFLPENTAKINDAFLGGIESHSDDAREIAVLCLPFLSKERCDDYNGWLEVGIAVHNIYEGSDEGLRLWDAWSKQSSEFKPGVCSERWAGFGERLDGRKLTVGSLVHWSNEDSEFFEAWEKHKTEKRIEHLVARSGEIQNTDYGNAQRLVALYGENLRYDHAHRVWYVWSGKQWQADSGAAVMQFAKMTAKAIYHEIPKTENDSRRQALAKWAVKSESGASLNAMVSLAESEPEIQVDISAFDTHPHLLNVENGVVDLRTGTLLPHDRELMLSNCVPIKYDPHAKCPTYDGFLKRIFQGNGNRGLIEYVQGAIGYSITGENTEQVFFICHGEGANGKSTLLETIHFLLGNLAGTVRTEVLMKHRFTSQSGHNDDVANLIGKRFVTASETESGHQLAETQLKQLTGGDTITASRKYGRGFSFRPHFKLWIAANHMPSIQDTDEGIWRRIRLIPFDEYIPESERDPRLKEKLQTEAEGILAWSVRGSVKWYSEGLGKAAEIDRATASYRNEQDTVANFIDESCEIGEGTAFAVAPTLLYESYKQSCVDYGADYLSQRQFADEMKKRDFEKGSVRQARGDSRKMWCGLRLKSPFDTGINPNFVLNPG